MVNEDWIQSVAALMQDAANFATFHSQPFVDLLVIAHCAGTSENARRVFWKINHRRDLDTALPEEIEQSLLTGLDEVERAYRVTYKPDREAPWEELYTYIHIAAAKAVVLQRKENAYTDEVRQTWERAHQALIWFGSDLLSGWVPWMVWSYLREYGEDTDESRYEYTLSLASVASLVFQENSRLNSIDHKYPEALHAMVLGLTVVAEGAVFIDELVSEDELLDGVLESYRPVIVLSAQEVVDVFENLRGSASKKDWLQVIRDCGYINEHWLMYHQDEFGEADEEEVLDSKGRTWLWGAYWHSAVGWSEAQLEPSQLLDEMKKAEDERAEERLKNYFFTEREWNAFPERAQRALINGERIWFATRIGRIESALEEFKVALEEILNLVFWQPLKQGTIPVTVVGTSLETALQSRIDPSLTEFEQLLDLKSFRDWLNGLEVDGDSNDMDIDELLLLLRGLRINRNIAEHRLGHSMQRERVSRYASRFLGVNCKGILPTLIDLGINTGVLGGGTWRDSKRLDE